MFFLPLLYVADQLFFLEPTSSKCLSPLHNCVLPEFGETARVCTMYFEPFEIHNQGSSRGKPATESFRECAEGGIEKLRIAPLFGIIA